MIGKALHIRRLWGCWNLTCLVESIDIIDLHVVCRITRWATSTLCELIWLWSLRMNLIRVCAEWAHSLIKLTWMPQLVNLVSRDCMMHLAGNTVSVVLVRATIAVTLGHHLEIVEVVSADTVCLQMMLTSNMILCIKLECFINFNGINQVWVLLHHLGMIITHEHARLQLVLHVELD